MGTNGQYAHQNYMPESETSTTLDPSGASTSWTSSDANRFAGDIPAADRNSGQYVPGIGDFPGGQCAHRDPNSETETSIMLDSSYAPMGWSPGDVNRFTGGVVQYIADGDEISDQYSPSAEYLPVIQYPQNYPYSYPI